jgi:hypothetical protein
MLGLPPAHLPRPITPASIAPASAATPRPKPIPHQPALAPHPTASRPLWWLPPLRLNRGPPAHRPAALFRAQRRISAASSANASSCLHGHFSIRHDATPCHLMLPAAHCQRRGKHQRRQWMALRLSALRGLLPS